MLAPSVVIVKLLPPPRSILKSASQGWIKGVGEACCSAFGTGSEGGNSSTDSSEKKDEDEDEDEDDDDDDDDEES